ncbi:GNAT family N-acetyltransferase [Colwellia sp. BRX10-1]|nr:GNAT family N-acetyltransferase [Colwellia sp. BRX8-7]MBA6372098.1 GNAT family N-acetyltransferase [Colwellia sp. BRX8-4]MBA6379237.1 GNAT family N-acetyltransferase [Colwellia sp. BRX10-7]MBA6385006.1 GNAT family N-acetyltransferase [Colwellia sp. BRX10-9]MBA6386017.1 GNAT family N-acetyltransferase [Colwellia sp. BRX10-2]MBA6403236.1 GNAT family N-acetyltransferase [Colwellia sp. BRX10-5]MBA6406894.1 GNAT family N-acetyltransferase [Colwellia sp. BRX10-1]
MELISSSAAHLHIELETPLLLSEKLNASVSSDWPSGEYDRDAMEFFLSCFEKGGKLAEGWYGWYAINIAVSGERTLVGSGGYFGPPDSNGIVEIGYSVLPSWQCRGYATEIVNLLISHACSFEETNSIIAHTAPENKASKKVLISNGFREVAMNDGLLSFEYTR